MAIRMSAIIMHATETTTTTEVLEGPVGGAVHRRWHPAFVVSVVLGAITLWLSVPRLEAETLRLSVLASLDSAERTASPPALMLRPQAQMMVDLGQRQELASAYSMAARFHLAMARGSAPGPDRAMQVHQAEKFLEAGLRLAPLSSENWQRLAYVRSTQGAWQDAAVAWQVSINTHPFDSDRLAARFEAGLVLWPYMTLQTRTAFSQQCAAYWAWDPDQFVDLVRYFGAKDIVDHAFAAMDAQRTLFDAKFAERAATVPLVPRSVPNSDAQSQKD
jgi:tetratricopeptide (TPR) repeat protein